MISHLQNWLDAVLMSASTVIVAINSRLLRLKAEPQLDKDKPESKPEAKAKTKPKVKK